MKTTSVCKHVFKRHIKHGTINTRLKTNNTIGFGGEYKRCVAR